MAFPRYDNEFDGYDFAVYCIILILLFIAGSINF